MHTRSRALLLLLLLAGGGLIALSWAGPGRDASARTRGAQPDAAAAATGSLEGGGAAERTVTMREAQGGTETGPVEEPTGAPGSTRMERLAGRMTIDGIAPEGTLELSSADGTWAFTARVLPDGSFGFGNVPNTELALRFEPDPAAAEPPRRLVLPTVAVRPAETGFEPQRLDWQSKHVNLRVLDEHGDPAAGALVTIRGEGCEDTFAADERGKARLGMVLAGTYAVRVERDGLSGENEVTVGSGNGLESLVIRLSTARVD